MLNTMFSETAIRNGANNGNFYNNMNNDINRGLFSNSNGLSNLVSAGLPLLMGGKAGIIMGVLNLIGQLANGFLNKQSNKTVKKDNTLMTKIQEKDNQIEKLINENKELGNALNSVVSQLDVLGERTNNAIKKVENLKEMKM